MVKMFIPAAAVFINHFSKQIKTVVLISDQENNDEKSDDFKDSISKTKKETDKIFVHHFEFVPMITRISVLFKQQDYLFKQTHFPPILTPPPNA
ncbi:MAG: hypothetical protein EOP41_01795 [Sphingobacteriaceae bacterium]|nr:MAG: hypothetical protein EOP41_01795 [Sphingobacteriaceae bacterium]